MRVVDLLATERVGAEGKALSLLPNRWGEGMIFAFSGMDGPTCASSLFVATAGAELYDLLIHTPRRRLLRVRDGGSGRVRVATGDVLIVETTSPEPLVLVYTAWHTLSGQLPAEGQVSLSFENGETDRSGEGGRDVERTVDVGHGDAVVLVREGRRFAVAYGRSPEEAQERAREALETELHAEVAARLAPYRHLPPLEQQDHARLLAKCLSVMRVNTLAPEGPIRQHWSTPDRVPHRHMWLWDSVFHSFGMNVVDPQLAWEFLQAVLDRQVSCERPASTGGSEGMIPHCMQVDGSSSAITQPPILAWGVWENARAHGANRDALAYALPRLEAYLAWNLIHRDTNGNGLLEWFIEDSPLCRSGESGMDNSPRFDRALLLDAVDFSTFQALDMAMTAKIARVLGEDHTARMWKARSDEMASRIHEQLWDPVQGFYCDREIQGELSPVKAVSGFLPLLLDTIPEDHVDALVAHLHNPATFESPFPVTSLSLDDPAWSTDMWRGATWINTNYLVVLGLMKHQRTEEADRIKRAWLSHLTRYYNRYGVLFEFYDAVDRVPPVACDRKGKRLPSYDIRRKMDSIRDYHWTAALTAHVLSGLDSTLLQGAC